MLSAEQQGNYDKVNRHKRAVINGLSHYEIGAEKEITEKNL